MMDRETDAKLDEAIRSLPALDEATLERIAAAVRSELRPVKPIAPTWVLVLGLMAIWGACSSLGAALFGFAGAAKLAMSASALIFGSLALLVGLLSRGFVNRFIPGSSQRPNAGSLLGITIAVLGAVFAFLFHEYRIADLVSGGVPCLLRGFFAAVLAASLGSLLLRRGFAVRPGSAGLLAGGFGALAGIALLELSCDNQRASHILLWHLGVLPLSAAVGAMVGYFLARRIA